jgi:DNA processing protein
MDLLTAVAVSMLPVSRLKGASAFKELRAADPAVRLEHVLAACGPPAGGVPAPVALEDARVRAEAALTAGAKLGVSPVPPWDLRYPALLSCIVDPPPVLWTAGDPALASRPCVAVIGSRAASPYAVQVARRVAAELAERGIVVVSGLARGVDSASHLGCLDAGGSTIAVTGSGLDRVYPAENRSLAARITDNGLLVSELAPGAPPLPEHFPLRNRIISGISLAVVVVEANEKSGSLITAACALRQGRDVMAVPGSVLTGRNRGSHLLLRDGAKVVETADDILEDMGWNSSLPSNTDHRSVLEAGRKLLSSDPLLSKMDAGEVYGLDDLVRMTGTAASKLLPRLMELELLGYIEAPGGGRFLRPLRPRSP